ncbi:MAG TPA: SGNH/GDSL hydrolase family protein [bacterium]
MRRSRAVRTLGLAAVCLLFQEVALRLVFPLPEIRGLNRIDYMSIGLEGGDTKAIRSIRVVHDDVLDRVRVVHRLNEYGFRGGRWAARKAPGAQRVLFVGDSFVEGGLTPDGETIPEGFEADLRRQGLYVEALNLGVSGAGLESELRLIVDAAPQLRPDILLLVVYANDLPADVGVPRPRSFGTYPAWKPRFLELLAMARNREQLPWRWPWRMANFLQPVPSPNNPWSDPEFERQFAEHVSPRVLALMKSARFSPYRMGGSQYLETDLRTPFDLRGALGGLREYLSRLGCRLLVVYIPERGTVTNYYQRFEREFSLGYPEGVDMTGPAYHLHRRLLREQCGDTGVPFLDLTDFIKREEDAGRHLYFDYDDHLSGPASSLAGGLVARWFAGAGGG